MAGEKAPRRPKAETPKGFRDYFGADVAERKAMLDAIASVYHRHGFDPLRLGIGDDAVAGSEPCIRLGYETIRAQSTIIQTHIVSTSTQVPVLVHVYVQV